MFVHLCVNAYLALLLIVMFVDPTSTIARTSWYPPGWTTLPTPEPLQLINRDGSDPAYPGTYKLAVSLVDKNGRVGPMGPVAEVSPAFPNWSLRIRLRGVAPLTKACAWLLWCKRDDGTTSDDSPQYEWRPYNGRHVEQVRPYLPLCGWDSHLTRSLVIKRAERRDPVSRWEPYENNTFWPKSEDIESPSASPEVEVLYVPNIQLGVRFAWVGNDGESLPSPLLTVDPVPGFAAENSSPIAMSRAAFIPPNGALGMHVYVSIAGVEHRQPAPHVISATTPNDWLWPLTMQRIYLERVVASGISPATVQGRSWLSSRNRAVYETQQSLIIDTDDPITCPIISPHKDRDGKFYDHRTIGGEIGQRWFLTTATSTPEVRDGDGLLVSPSVSGYATDWPCWVETAQRTRLVGCFMKSPTAIGGIDFMSYIGSSCFHFRSERLFMELTKDGYTFGVRTIAEARGVDGHSASEPLFADTEIACRFPFVVEYGQSANWQANNTTAICIGNDLASCVFTVNNSGNFKATGRTTTDGGRALVAAMSAKQIKIDEWFSDQGHPVWAVLGGYGGGTRLEIICAATNHQGFGKSFLHLVEAPSTGFNSNELLLSGNSGSVGWQEVPVPEWGWWITRTDVDSLIFCPRYAGVKYSIAPLNLLNLFQTPQPNWAQWQGMTYIASSGLPTAYYLEWDKGIDPATIVSLPKILGTVK